MFLSSCQHFYHKECLQSYLKWQLDTASIPFICPDASCKQEISERNINELLSKKEKEKYEYMTLSKAADQNKDTSWCPTAGCNNMFFFLEGDSSFKCEMCHKHYCLNCRVPYHRGQSCKEYEISHRKDKNDEEFMKFVSGQKLKQCPKCNFWV